MSLDKVKDIILILSGKGGVGKSSITTQVALSLSLAGKSVGVLDIDLTGPSIPRFLGIEDEKVRQAPGGWLPVEVHPAGKLPSTSSSSSSSLSSSTEPDQIGSLHAMSLAFLLASRSTAIVWRGPKKTAMCKQFLTDVKWAELDYLLIDTPPGTSDEHISVVENLLKKVSVSKGSTTDTTGPRLSGAILVTTPQAISTADVRKEINFCAKTGVPVIGVVENMSGYVCPCCGVSTNIFSKGGGEIMAAEFGVKFLGAVPVDQLWGSLVEEGIRPVYKEVAQPNDNEEGGGDGIEVRDGEDSTANVKKHHDAPLVDKYRDCSLYPIFKDIAKQVIETAEAGTAVFVSPNAARET